MTYFESLAFVYEIVLYRFDLPVITWGVGVFALSLVLGHQLCGRLWNKKWRFFRSPTAATASLFIATVLGVGTIASMAVDRSFTWMEMQQTELQQQYPNNGVRNRTILRETQELLGRPANLDNTLLLEGPEDLRLLALVAARHVSCPLVPHGPFGPGAPCSVNDPEQVADEVVRTLPITSYPLSITPNNQWTRAALLTQLEKAIHYTTERLELGLSELRTALRNLIWLLIVLQLVIVSWVALADIRTHPKS